MYGWSFCDITGPGPLSGGIKSSRAGRAGIHAVSAFGPNTGNAALCPNASEPMRGKQAASVQSRPAKRVAVVDAVILASSRGAKQSTPKRPNAEVDTKYAAGGSVTGCGENHE